MKPVDLTNSLKIEAKRLGFDLVAATPAVTPTGYSHLANWLDAGFGGEMHYLRDRQLAYEHPKYVMQGVIGILVLGLNYFSKPAENCGPATGRIARYGWGDGDYHDLIHSKLKLLKRFATSIDNSIVSRGVVDTAPLLEREFAQLAGLGWRAKNTMLISREIGSWFFLAAFLINKPLEYDIPSQTDHCGTCTACLDACPTQAFVEPRLLDASKCISYLTIEHRSPIPLDLRDKMGEWLLGCDVCQDVCPWNRMATESNEPSFEPGSQQNPVDLAVLFDLDDTTFRARFRKTPLWRPKRRGILRNAAIVLGNRPCKEAVAPLIKGLSDVEPLVRGACAWALGRQAAPEAEQALRDRQPLESDETVTEEILLALSSQC